MAKLFLGARYQKSDTVNRRAMPKNPGVQNFSYKNNFKVTKMMISNLKSTFFSYTGNKKIKLLCLVVFFKNFNIVTKRMRTICNN